MSVSHVTNTRASHCCNTVVLTETDKKRVLGKVQLSFATLFLATMVPCAAVGAQISNPIASDTADDIPIHLASNPHYFEFEGTTTPLIGTSGDYMISYCTDPDYAAMFDRIAGSNLNAIRLFTYVPIGWCGGGAY